MLNWAQSYCFENKKHEAPRHKKGINLTNTKTIFKFPLFKTLRDKPRFHNGILLVQNTEGEDREISN